MAIDEKKQSSLGTIVFTTNIPGDKEHTLDPTIISYSDNPDLKITKTTNKFYSYNDKIINPSFFTGKTRSNILNILFNKNRFEKFAYPHFDASNNQEVINQEVINQEVITKNALSYIENIFTTFPKSYNIKQIANANKPGGLKLSIPFTSIPYTYLKVNGMDHTVSRVIYYDDMAKNDISVEILNDFNEFDNWVTGKNTDKVFKEPLVKNFEKLFDKNMTKTNLINTFGEGNGTRTFDKEITALEEEIRKKDEDIDRLNKEIKIIEYNLELPNDTWIKSKVNNKYDDIKNWFEEYFKKNDKGTLLTNFVLDTALTDYNKLYKTDHINISVKDKTSINSWANTAALNGDIVVNLLKLLQFNEDNKKTDKNDKKYWLFDVNEENQKLTDAIKKKEAAEAENKKIEANKTIYNDGQTNDGQTNGSYLIANIKVKLIGLKEKGTKELTRTEEEEMNTFENVIDVIDNEYKNISELNNELKDIVEIQKATNACRIISDQLKQIKKPTVLSSSLFPPNTKLQEIIVLLDSFLTHSDIYTSFIKKMYDTDLLDSKYSKYNEYKQYIDFIRKINKIYEYNDEIELVTLRDMIKEGKLVKVSKDSGFENETIRLHIDLIKGKVNDDNIKQFNCAYKDYDLVERWNKLDEIPDDDVKFEPLNYFNLDDIKVNNPKQIKNTNPKQIKKGGKRTRKRRRKKGAYTRKR